jgi:hypothetical protein
MDYPSHFSFKFDIRTQCVDSPDDLEFGYDHIWVDAKEGF